jgi:hypothetical protein
MKPETQEKKQRKINDMLQKINLTDEPPTKGKYHILRVVAAFPLDVNFSTTSKVVRRALEKDEHPLASMSHEGLISALSSTLNGSDMIRQLRDDLQNKGGAADGNGSRRR